MEIEALERALDESGDVENPTTDRLTLLRHAVAVETMYSNSGYERQDYPNRPALEMSRLLVEHGANVDIGGFALGPVSFGRCSMSSKQATTGRFEGRAAPVAIVAAMAATIRHHPLFMTVLMFVLPAAL